MSCVAVLPVRMGASRLPGKPMRRVKGEPLVHHLILRLRHCKRLDGIVVATTTQPADNVIAEWCRGAAVECFRGSEDDVCGRVIAALQGCRAETGVMVYGDGPLLDPAILEQLIALQRQEACDWAGNSLRTTWPPGMECEVFSVSALIGAAGAVCDPAIREHATLCLRQAGETYRLHSLAAPPALARPDVVLEVDTAQDLEVIRILIEDLGVKADTPLAEMIALWDRHPALADLSRGIERRWRQYRQ